MKKQLTLLLTGAALTFGGMQFSQSLTASQEPADAQMSPEEMQEMMMKMMEKAQPGPEHKKLQAMAGEWTTKIKMKMSPDADWEHHTGHSKIQSALGGRYMIEKFTAELGMMGKMEGLLILSYNNLTEEYESIWMDNMSTWPQFAKGQINEDGATELRGKMRDVITPEGRPYRHVTHPVDADHHITKMYDTIPPTGDIQVMEIEYTRVEK
ncbi:MAG: DUF1579 family protein [Planctomycetota bacterium]